MQVLFSIFTAFIIVLMMTPFLVRIARDRNIFDEPGERKLHKSRTPLLGGVAVFAGTLISFLFWSAGHFEPPLLFLLVSLLILFVTGFVDDLYPLLPKVKLFLQIAAAVITVLFSRLSISGLHGLFGIHTLPGIFSVVISVLFVLVIVNAFNFIDGIDGLAASVGIIASCAYGLMFLSIHDNLFAILSFSLCGALAAFLLFNISPAKIFMGDTGTLFAGFLLALLTIQLTESMRNTPSELGWLNYRSAPVFALALLIVPVIDFARVTLVRIVNRRSPIKADKNHLHHLLVRLGFSHGQTTLLLVTVNIFFVASALLLRKIDQSVLFFCMVATGILLSQVPSALLRRRTKKISS
jgi:UDP-GlcNAc:undecaprenyl-phosphate/decaprenyl-phosphate GlcNAc-1-phosphate transferase